MTIDTFMANLRLRNETNASTDITLPVADIIYLCNEIDRLRTAVRDHEQMMRDINQALDHINDVMAP